MPANFDSYVSGLKPVETKYGKDWKTGNPLQATYDNDAVRRLALEVVKANFPDITQAATNRVKFVSGEPKDYNAAGDYTPMSGEARVSARYTAAISPQVAQYTDLKTGKKSADVNITTNEVMQNVYTLLHEIQHARGIGGFAAPNRQAILKQAGITDDMLAVVNKLATEKTFNGALPSMNLGKVPDLEEFLASAVPLQEMEKRKMLPESGRLRAMSDTIKSIIQTVPQMQQFIDVQSRPDLPTATDPGPTITQLIKSALFGEQK